MRPGPVSSFRGLHSQEGAPGRDVSGARGTPDGRLDELRRLDVTDLHVDGVGPLLVGEPEPVCRLPAQLRREHLVMLFRLEKTAGAGRAPNGRPPRGR